MIYKVKFVPSAYKEWKKLDKLTQSLFKKKLEKRILEPKILKDRLNGHTTLYKIKLRSVGYRLVYQVDETAIVIIVLSVGKRNNSIVYKKAFERIASS